MSPLSLFNITSLVSSYSHVPIYKYRDIFTYPLCIHVPLSPSNMINLRTLIIDMSNKGPPIPSHGVDVAVGVMV